MGECFGERALPPADRYRLVLRLRRDLRFIPVMLCDVGSLAAKQSFDFQSGGSQEVLSCPRSLLLPSELHYVGHQRHFKAPFDNSST